MCGKNIPNSLLSTRRRTEKPIRVCIRGLAGLLGNRLAQMINRVPDMELTIGIVKKDPTLTQYLKSIKTLSEPLQKKSSPKKLYLDEKQKVVQELNQEQNLVEFIPADQLNLSKECDMVVDCSSPGTLNSWLNKYKQFPGQVLLQSGDYPLGRLITLPLTSKNENGNIYRQGDCILCGVVPVLVYMSAVAKKVSISTLTQYTEKLNDYTTDIRLRSVYKRNDVRERIEKELASLLDYNLTVLSSSEIPGLSYYTIDVLLETEKPTVSIYLKHLLKDKPRILVLPHLTSTFEIQMYKERVHSIGLDTPPITVFGCDLNSVEATKKFRFTIGLDYKPLVALANLDSMRMLTTGISAEESMRTTDKYMGFTSG